MAEEKKTSKKVEKADKSKDKKKKSYIISLNCLM